MEKLNTEEKDKKISVSKLEYHIFVRAKKGFLWANFLYSILRVFIKKHRQVKIDEYIPACSPPNRYFLIYVENRSSVYDNTGRRD